MLVRRLEMFPIESIVRGYITGTAWAEYSISNTVNGMPLPGLEGESAHDARGEFASGTEGTVGIQVMLARGGKEKRWMFVAKSRSRSRCFEVGCVVEGGPGSALSVNLKQAMSLRSNEPLTLDGAKDT